MYQKSLISQKQCFSMKNNFDGMFRMQFWKFENFWVGQHLLPKCCPNLLLNHRHVEATIWEKFCNYNSNFKGGTFSDADRPTLAEAPISIYMHCISFFSFIRCLRLPTSESSPEVTESTLYCVKKLSDFPISRLKCF